MKRPALFALNLPLTFFLLVLLGGCGRSDLPPDAPLALVHGSVTSPIFDELRKSVNLVPYTGAQQVADHDLVVLDGNYHTPESLRDDELVAEALRAGKWVLVLDAADEHKRVGLGERVQAFSCGASPAYAVRTDLDAYGRREVAVMDFPFPTAPVRDETPEPGSPNAAPTLKNCAEEPGSVTADMAASFTSAFLQRLVAPLQPAQTPSNDPPEGLLYQTFYYTVHVPNTKTGPSGWAKESSQEASLQVDYTFTVYLNNKNNPQGDFQYVLGDVQISANPTAGRGNFTALGYTYGLSTVEHAWFQDGLTALMMPFQTDWTLLYHSPETENGETELETGVDFSVGFNGEGPESEFNYSSSTTQTIKDWKVTDESSGVQAQWYYRSAYPVDSDIDYGCGPDQHIWTYPVTCFLGLRPNDLSLSNLQLHAQAVWKTEMVEDRVVEIDTSVQYRLLDLFCATDDLFLCGADEAKASTLPIFVPANFSIDFGTVIPAEIASLTFNPNPVAAGQSATGTLTLAKAAPVDLEFALASSSPNATVLPHVSVKRGETAATFQVLTNANALPSGSSTVATITVTGEQGQQQQVQLTVQN